jgi:hypothetical protein
MNAGTASKIRDIGLDPGSLSNFPMRTLVTVSPEDHRRLLHRLRKDSPLHDLLETGVLIKRSSKGVEQMVVYMTCDHEQVQSLLRVAQQFRPQVPLKIDQLPQVRQRR